MNYLDEIEEAKKARLARLQQPPPKRLLPERHSDKCVNLVIGTYRQKLGKRYLPITRDDIFGPSRKTSIVLARDVAIYLTRKTSKMTLPRIGKSFNKTHSSVIYSIAKVEGMMKKSLILKKDIERLLAEVK